MKNIKRTLALVLTLCMALSLLPVTALAAPKVPPLTVKGDRWPCDEETLQTAWKKYYPLMVRYLGEPSEDFWTQGVTWIMTDETLAHGNNEWNADTNTVEMGVPVHATSVEQCIGGLYHETGHMWLQYNNEALVYNFGQWMTEAATNIVGLLLVANDIVEAGPTYSFDIWDSMGWEYINGVVTDGDKHCRRISDNSAGLALYYLDTVLSSAGTFDYLVKVNRLLMEYAAEHGIVISAETYAAAMDEVAAGKTIDGMQPSEWLFSRAASNTAGSDGTYLYAYPNLGEVIDGNNWAGHDSRVNLMGWTRTSRKETGLSGQAVTVSAYDYSGALKGSKQLTLAEDGSVEKTGIGADGFAPYSALRFTATMTVAGKNYSSTCFSLALPDGEYIKNDDDRLFFLLTDGDEKIITDLTAADILVSGANRVDTSHLATGMLIVTATQGAEVTVTSPAGSRTISKPLGSRIIPLTVTGAPATYTKTPFKDVPDSAYYADAVAWAVENAVTKGISEDTFSPYATCTRGQVVTFLWRSAGSPKPVSTNNPFMDVKAGSYYHDAVLWAVEQGITNGTSATTFSPEDTCTSDQVVTFLWRAKGSPETAQSSALAKKYPNAYYTDALAWADNNGLLENTNGPLVPSANSPRANIVTYLYRFSLN